MLLIGYWWTFSDVSGAIYKHCWVFGLLAAYQNVATFSGILDMPLILSVWLSVCVCPSILQLSDKLKKKQERWDVKLLCNWVYCQVFLLFLTYNDMQSFSARWSSGLVLWRAYMSKEHKEEFQTDIWPDEVLIKLWWIIKFVSVALS